MSLAMSRSTSPCCTPGAPAPPCCARRAGRRFVTVSLVAAGVTASGRASAQDGAPPERSPTCTAELDVHLVDSYLHEPIAQARVAVGAAWALSDGRGHALLRGLCPGPSVVEVVHPAFEELRHPVALGQRRAIELELVPIVETIEVEQRARPPVELRPAASLSGEALERRRGQPLADALAELPGVGQLRAGTGLGKPMVRGQFGRRVPMLVDGVRHRAQDWGIDHAPEVDPALAERLTVVRGAAGVRYGSDAVGGVVLVEPPGAASAPGVKAETHLVGYQNGLGAGLSGRVQVAPASAPGLTLRLDGGGKRVGAPATPDYPLDNTGEAEWSGGLTAHYLAGGTSYQLSLRHFETRLGVCSCLQIASIDEFRARLVHRQPLSVEHYRADATIERPFQAVAHELALARARTTLGSLGTLTATYALQYDDRREYDSVRQATRGPQFSFRLLTQDVEAVLDRSPVHLGQHLHLTGQAGVTGMLQSHSYRGLHLVPSHEAQGTGVFATERLWGHDWVLEAGLRYDYLARQAEFLRRDFQRLVRSGQVEQDGCGALAEDTEPVRCASRYHTVSASLGGLVELASDWTAKLELATTSRPPNPDEQYLNGTAPSLPVLALGRPDARAETAWSASATLARAGTTWRGELSGFGSYIDDYLYFAPAMGADGQPIFDVLIRGSFPRFTTRSVDALFWGADGQVAVTPVRWLELGAQAQAVRAHNLTDDGYLVFVPPDRARGSLTLRRSALLGLREVWAMISGSLVRRQTRFDPAADLAPPPAGYALVEAQLGGELSIAGQTVKLALSGSNLTGARYREYTSLLRYFADMPGRQILVRISMFHDG